MTLRKRVIDFILICVVLMGIAVIIPHNAQAADSKFIIKKGALVKYNGSDTKITIPKNVKAIKREAFSYCDNLQSVTIPGNVKKIGIDAFRGCSNLEKVVIKNGTTTIESGAFSICDKLKSVTIPKSVKEIEDGVFYETPWLAKKSKQRKDKLVIINHILVDGQSAKGKVKIPKGVTAIADDAFLLNSKVSSVTIPDTVKTVGKGAFRQTSIKKITFPKSVRNVGEGALYACFKLKEVTILNPRAKLRWGKGFYGGTIFDGKPFEGNDGCTIVIKGRKNSTAAKLAKYMNSISNKSAKKRYKKAVFKVAK